MIATDGTWVQGKLSAIAVDRSLPVRSCPGTRASGVDGPAVIHQGEIANSTITSAIADTRPGWNAVLPSPLAPSPK